MSANETLGPPPLVKKLEKLEFLFRWVRWFYPKAKEMNPFYLLYYFFPQKILRINGSVPWPVHFTSRVLYHKNIQAGNRIDLGMNAGCYIQARNGIIVGNNTRIGPGVGILSINHHINDYDRWDTAEPIEIGDNVWVGMNAVILPGVKIGDNVAISAGSVVNKDIPSDSIAGGNPCRVVRQKEPYQGETYD